MAEHLILPPGGVAIHHCLRVVIKDGRRWHSQELSGHEVLGGPYIADDACPSRTEQ